MSTPYNHLLSIFLFKLIIKPISAMGLFYTTIVKKSNNTIKTTGKQKEPKTLAGIWKNKGFEKIKDLDGEIRNLRKELGNQILERHI
jgi:hypothetical protein